MQKLKSGLLLIGFLCGFFVSTLVTTPASAEISQSPLFLSTAAEPNIMFTLDDSGSMQWESLPEEITKILLSDKLASCSTSPCVMFMFPRPSMVYGGSDYPNKVSDFDATNKYSTFFRSSHNNKIYYNPAITYEPWVDSNNTSYPDATPTAALNNPRDSTRGNRNLTIDNTQFADWLKSNGTFTSSTSKTFYPATYFRYNGGDVWNPSNYTRVEIRSSIADYTGSASRKDCAAAPTCTYAKEIQNFANWYTYYRSRILATRAGVGKAFAKQGEKMRVGFAAINKSAATIDGVSTDTIVKGMRPFSGTDRTNFFNSLYDYPIPLSGTPLRVALDNVGKYFRRTDSKGPWGNSPGTGTETSSTHLACRMSYDIFMTDGYWNGGGASTATGNVDNNLGPSISGPKPNPPPANLSYQYSPANPYKDNWSDTLADVAMYYWNRDLRSDIVNRVPATAEDPAFWQHLVNFTVGLGVTGSLNPTADLEGLTAGTKFWPNPSSANPAKVDDLWHAALNSRGEFFSSTDPDTFAQALSATLTTIVSRTSSASAVATNSTRLDTGTLIYQAKFNSGDWSGHLLAYQINSNGSIGAVKWDAADKIPASGTRSIFSYEPTKPGTNKGISFVWNDLNLTQKTALNMLDSKGQDRLNYLRGDQSNEQPGGPFRKRSVLLGDIINSDPWFVGTENFGYHSLPSPEGPAYTTFRNGSSYTGRRKMIYVGANDGMLHGFDVANDTTNGGTEIFAYVPDAIISKLSKLTDPTYGAATNPHQYFVDGAPKAGDAYINSAWRTLLIGTLGAGGKGVFVLDVTDPDGFDTSKVRWEVTDTTDLDGLPGLEYADLGYTLPQPSIVRLANGDWGVIVANGYDSVSKKAVLYILDAEDGSIVKKFDTLVGDATKPNGLSTPIAVDKDGNRIVDVIFAGDLQGNLWEFDVSDTSASGWDFAYGGASPEPFFVACSDQSNCTTTRQPITAKPQVGLGPNGQGLMVYFGTGKYFETGDNIVGSSPQVQTYYALRENGAQVSGRDVLQEQTILDEGTVGSTKVRVTSDSDVDYNNNQEGWYMDLTPPSPSSPAGERVVSPSLLRGGRIIFVSIIPEPDPCSFGGTSWLYELDALSGSRFSEAQFDVNGDGKITKEDLVQITDTNNDGVVDANDKVPPSAKELPIGISKNPSVISAGDLEHKYSSGTSGDTAVTTEQGAEESGRLSWRQFQ